MMHPRELSNHVKGLSLDAMKILAHSIDTAIDRYMSGASQDVPITPELFSWFIRFLCINMAELECLGNEEEAALNAGKIVVLFNMIDASAGAITSDGRARWEGLAQTKDEMVDFLSNRPNVTTIDQTYGGKLPKNLIETNGLIIR